MPSVLPVSGASAPLSSDAPTSAGVLNMGATLDSFVVGRFATSAARTTAIPTPATRQLAMVGDVLYRYNGSAWVPVNSASILYDTSVATASATTTSPVTLATSGSIVLPTGNWIIQMVASCLMVATGNAATGRLVLGGIPPTLQDEKYHAVAGATGRMGYHKQWTGSMSGTISLSASILKVTGAATSVDAVQGQLQVILLGPA